jgi:hypothetical protein
LIAISHNSDEVRAVADKKEKKSKAQKQGEAVAKSFVSKTSIRQDSGGWYTGHPAGPDKKPEQDADDL